jgi:hypothetical protein
VKKNPTLENRIGVGASVMPVRRSVWVCAATWGGVWGVGWSRWFCSPYGCCRFCVLEVVVSSGLLVSGGLLSKGHLLLFLLHRANTPVLCLAPAWQRADTLRHSGVCPCGVGVGCCVAVRICRSVMGCGASSHR